MVMPGMTGQELAVQLQREHPGVSVVFMSGYSGTPPRKWPMPTRPFG